MRNSIWMVLFVLPLHAWAADDPPKVRPPGAELTTQTTALKAGAAVLQTDNPLDPMHIHLIGFHVLKKDSSHQMAAHHFCSQVNEDFAQCVLFDGNTRNANLNGIEYIISDKLFNELPAGERQYWHPHNYEILSGTLIGPRLPDIAETALMKGKINSYGKTWHVWDTGSAEQKGDRLPFGEPGLAWSFNRDGEARPGLVETRDKAMEVDSAAKRRARAELVPLARPQVGVDALHGKFGGATRDIPGVSEAASSTSAGDSTPKAAPPALSGRPATRSSSSGASTGTSPPPVR